MATPGSAMTGKVDVNPPKEKDNDDTADIEAASETADQ